MAAEVSKISEGAETAKVMPASKLGSSWNQWRGPERNGAVAPGWLPAPLPEALERRWRVPASRGHGAPVVADGRIFVHGRDGDDEVVSAHHLNSGEVAWTARYAAPFTTNQYATAHGQGPFSTPLVADGRVFTVGTSGILSAFDAASGELLWRHDESPQVSSAKLFTGTAASPLLVMAGERGELILHLGDDSGGRVYAFDAASGRVRWKTTTDGPGYASAILVDGPGGLQAVTMTEKSLLSVAVADGEILWTHPFPDEWNENILTPVVAGDVLIFGGVRTGVLALEVVAGEETVRPEVRWQRKEPTLYMSTPVVDGGRLWGFSNKRKGHLFTLRVADGEVLASGAGRQGDSATLLDAGSHVLALTTEGRLLVVAKENAGTGEGALTPQRVWTVAESATWASPTPVAGGVLVRDFDGLSRWDFPGAVAASAATGAPDSSSPKVDPSAESTGSTGSTGSTVSPD